MSGRIRRAQRSAYLRLEVSNTAPEPVHRTPFSHPRALAGETEVGLAAANIAAILDIKGTANVSSDMTEAPPHMFHDPMLALDASQVAVRSVLTRLGVAYDIGVGGYSPSARRWVQHVTRLLLDVPAAWGIIPQDVPCPGESFELRWPSDEALNDAIRQNDMPELSNRALAAACLCMTTAYDANMVCALGESDKREGFRELGLSVIEA